MRHFVAICASLALATIPGVAHADTVSTTYINYTGTVMASGQVFTQFPDGTATINNYSNLAVQAFVTLKEITYPPSEGGSVTFLGDNFGVYLPDGIAGPDVVELYPNHPNCLYEDRDCVEFDFDYSGYPDGNGPLPTPTLDLYGDRETSYTDAATGATLYLTDDYNGELSLATSTTPELSSFALLGTGLLGMVGVVRKRLAQGS